MSNYNPIIKVGFLESILKASKEVDDDTNSYREEMREKLNDEEFEVFYIIRFLYLYRCGDLTDYPFDAWLEGLIIRLGKKPLDEK